MYARCDGLLRDSAHDTENNMLPECLLNPAVYLPMARERERESDLFAGEHILASFFTG